MTLPFWIYVIIAGIFISAFMAIKTAKEDREIETEWIEKEGEMYLERMKQEKERRKSMKITG